MLNVDPKELAQQGYIEADIDSFFNQSGVLWCRRWAIKKLEKRHKGKLYAHPALSMYLLVAKANNKDYTALVYSDCRNRAAISLAKQGLALYLTINDERRNYERA